MLVLIVNEKRRSQNPASVWRWLPAATVPFPDTGAVLEAYSPKQIYPFAAGFCPNP